MTTQTSLPSSLGMARKDALPAGYRLQGFEVQSVLAQSSIAVVYRGLDLARAAPVVIKEFLPTGLARRELRHRVTLFEGADAAVFERARQTFIDEGHLLERCRHRSLMRVLHVLEENGTAYRVMPDCPGSTLLDLRRAMPEPPTDKRLRSWLESLLGALAELHAAGRVHGAVAPGNILMTADDCPVLLDSSAVREVLVSDQTRSMIAALPPCVAPREQTEPGVDRPLGPWTDLYSLAATLHFCMTGNGSGRADRARSPGPPESVGTPAARAAAMRSSHSVGPAWLAALSTCLAEDPVDRPQSVAQLRRLFDIERPRRPAAVAAAASSAPAAVPAPQPASPSVGGIDAQHASAPHAIAAAPDASDAAWPGPDGAPVPAAEGASTKPVGDEPVTPTVALDLAEPAVTDAVENAAAGRLGPAQRHWLAAVAVVLLVVIASAYIGLQPSRQSPQTPAPAVASVGPAVASPPAKESLAPPAGAAAVQEVPAAPSQNASPVPPTRVAQPKAAGAAPPAKLPAAPSPAAARTPPAKARTGTATPREACAGRERYALLQCMEAQCARKVWTQHAQCVRLRKERRL